MQREESLGDWPEQDRDVPLCLHNFAVSSAFDLELGRMAYRAFLPPVTFGGCRQISSTLRGMRGPKPPRVSFLLCYRPSQPAWHAEATVTISIFPSIATGWRVMPWSLVNNLLGAIGGTAYPLTLACAKRRAAWAAFLCADQTVSGRSGSSFEGSIAIDMKMPIKSPGRWETWS